jgi:ABC-type polysaccharide/polyol phosphate export permease
MTWNQWVRQIHRWVSIVFAGIVAALFAMLGAGVEPAQWMYLLPLLPLALLALTGLYMFALPYVAKRDRGQRAAR